MIFQVEYRTWTGSKHATYDAARRELLSNFPAATPVSEKIPSEDGHGQLWLNPTAPSTAGSIMCRKSIVRLSAAEAWDHIQRGGRVVRLNSSASRWYVGSYGQSTGGQTLVGGTCTLLSTSRTECRHPYASPCGQMPEYGCPANSP